MRFYHCKREEDAKYVVSAYGWNTEDKFYFDKLEDAVELFDAVKAGKHKDVTILSLYDLENDMHLERVEFAVA